MKEAICNDNVFVVSSSKKIEQKQSRSTICDHIDDIDELTYKKLYSIMASESNYLCDKEPEQICEYLLSWLSQYYQKNYIWDGVHNLCAETPQAIVSYLHLTFRRHILNYRDPKKIDRYTDYIQDIFSYDDSDDCPIADPNIPEEPFIAHNKLIVIKEIVLSLSKKHQLAFLNMAYRSYRSWRTEFLETESQANRNQLVKRMKDILKESFSKNGVKSEHFYHFLESEFMSEIYTLITSIN